MQQSANLIANVEPKNRPVYLRFLSPNVVEVDQDGFANFSFLDGEKADNPPDNHTQWVYTSYPYLRTYFNLPTVDQLEMNDDIKRHLRYEIVKLPLYGTLETFDFQPTYDLLTYTPAISFYGKDSFTVRPVCPEYCFVGEPFEVVLDVLQNGRVYIPTIKVFGYSSIQNKEVFVGHEELFKFVVKDVAYNSEAIIRVTVNGKTVFDEAVTGVLASNYRLADFYREHFQIFNEIKLYTLNFFTQSTDGSTNFDTETLWIDVVRNLNVSQRVRRLFSAGKIEMQDEINPSFALGDEIVIIPTASHTDQYVGDPTRYPSYFVSGIDGEFFDLTTGLVATGNSGRYFGAPLASDGDTSTTTDIIAQLPNPYYVQRVENGKFFPERWVFQNDWSELMDITEVVGGTIVGQKVPYEGSLNFRVVWTGEELSGAITNDVTLEDMFSGWTFHSHSGDAQPANETERTSWTYDPVSDTIWYALNSGTAALTVFDDPYLNFTFSVRATSTSADNDRMGVVIAAMEDANGRMHTISAVRNQDTAGWTWRIYYNFRQTGSKVLAEGTDLLPRVTSASNPNGNWNHFSKGTVIRVVRNGNLISAYSSPPDGENWLESSRLSINLEDDSLLHKFFGAQRFGLVSFSQANSRYAVLENSTLPWIIDARSGQIFGVELGKWTSSSRNIYSYYPEGLCFYQDEKLYVFVDGYLRGSKGATEYGRPFQGRIEEVPLVDA